jgi:hypothetical protein
MNPRKGNRAISCMIIFFAVIETPSNLIFKPKIQKLDFNQVD